MQFRDSSEEAAFRAELRARVVGNAAERDDEEIQFWRAASDTVHGQTLYQLLRFAQNVLNSTPPRPEEPLTFPGIPAAGQRRQPPTQP